MAETQLGGIKKKEDVNATALAAEVSDKSHTITFQGAEFIELSEFYQESVAKVKSKEATTHVLEKPKKSRRPRQKKKNNNSNATGLAIQMQPANINQPSSNAGEKIEVHCIQEPSTSKMHPPGNIKPLAAEQGVAEAISNQVPMTQVLPVIAEEMLTNILGNPKKPRKPRQKKKKTKSKVTEQALQMQLANINQTSSTTGENLKVHSIPEPFTNEINPTVNTKPLAAEQYTSFKGTDKMALKFIDSSEFYQEAVAQVQPVIAEEILTDMLGKTIKSRKWAKKKDNSNTTEQVQQMQPANINRASTSTHDVQVHFIPQPCKTTMNPLKNIKSPAPLVEQGVPAAISDQDLITQVLPVIAEEVSTNILGKSKQPRKPRHKKNKNISNTTEQALQIPPANINKLLSSAVENTQVFFIEETSKSMIYPARLAKRGVPYYQYSMAEALPVIIEETPEDILKNEMPKKQKKHRQKKKKNSSSTVEQALQMLPADNNRASSKIELYQIKEPSTSNAENKKLVDNRDAKAINYNEMNQKSLKGQQTKNVLVAVESKQHGQKISIVNNNFAETMTEKKLLPIENVPEVDDAMQQTDEKAEGSANTAAHINYSPSKSVEKKDEQAQSSKDELKEPDQKEEENAEPQVQRHLLFFRQNYDHSGRLSLRNFNEGRLHLDGLYSQVKLACMDTALKKKIGQAIHLIMNDTTIDLKDFCVPVDKLEILFNRMHNLIFIRLYRVGLTELASIETCNILAIYRSHFKRADDLRFLFSLMSSEELKYFSK